MNTLHPIYTELNDCQDCYKCVRWCPVKAIKVEKDTASILQENCIYCGRCAQICPVEAKKVRDDLPRAQYLVNRYENVMLSLAPSYVAEFPGVTPEQMIQGIKKLGFSKVSETAIGAEIVSKACGDMLKQKGNPLIISSACPVVVELIRKYYPHLLPRVSALYSPMLAHATFLRSKKYIETKVVFVGPCLAKKTEADAHPDLVDAALTFEDLKDWFKKEDIVLKDLKPEETQSFYPAKAASSAYYPVDGGMINNIKSGAGAVDFSMMSFSGIGNIKKVLQGLEKWELEKPLFLELLACEGGCINGPASGKDRSLAEKRFRILNTEVSEKTEEINFPNHSIKCHYEQPSQKHNHKFNEADVVEALKAIGKHGVKDELNCGGCGYNSCRDFAAAYLEGKAELNMCVSYMRRIAQDKASALLQKMPSGVVMVNEEMKVIELNESFARMLGAEVEMIYEANPGLAGADITKLVPFHKLFLSALNHGESNIEKDIRHNGRLFHVSVFTIQKHRIVCGLFRDMFAPEVRKEEVVNRTRKVIKENLSTVQKIAFLLGENASKTEAILNSIAESHHAQIFDDDE